MQSLLGGIPGRFRHSLFCKYSVAAFQALYLVSSEMKTLLTFEISLCFTTALYALSTVSMQPSSQ